MTNESNPYQKELLTEKECAERLSVRRETLSLYRRDLKLPFIALGEGLRPRIRYNWTAVQAWLDGRTRNVAKAQARKRGRPRNVDRGFGHDGGPQ